MSVVILVTRVLHGEETLVAAVGTATEACQAQDIDMARCFEHSFSDVLWDPSNEEHMRLFNEISYSVEVLLVD